MTKEVEKMLSVNEDLVSDEFICSRESRSEETSSIGLLVLEAQRRTLCLCCVDLFGIEESRRAVQIFPNSDYL